MKKFIFPTLLTALLLLAGCGPAQPGPYAELAQCLTEKGVKFYGAFWCPHCADQKKLFGSDIRYITYVECDARGAGANPQACKAAGVTKYPTWAFPGQGNVEGVLRPEELAQKANCEVTPQTQETQTQETTQP